MAMREGSAETLIACAPETAFAWLADPGNAGAWFASVTLLEPPERPLRVGAAWRFSMTRQRGRLISLRLAAYQPPQTFTWETTYPAWRDNLQWTIALEPAHEDEAEDEAPHARLRLTIRKRPGPFGWPMLAIAAALGRLGVTEAASMVARAERAAERARDALAAASTLSYGARPPRAPRPANQQRTGAPRGNARKGVRRRHPAPR